MSLGRPGGFSLFVQGLAVSFGVRQMWLLLIHSAWGALGSQEPDLGVLWGVSSLISSCSLLAVEAHRAKHQEIISWGGSKRTWERRKTRIKLYHMKRRRPIKLALTFQKVTSYQRERRGILYVDVYKRLL